MKVYFHALPIECPECGTKIVSIVNVQVRADGLLLIECLCHQCGPFEDQRSVINWLLWSFCQDTKPKTDDEKYGNMLDNFQPKGKPN